MPGFWICFLFWICQDSGYTKVLNMHETINTNCNISFLEYVKLRRILIMTEYAWIILGYAWMYLKMSKWFCYTFTHCNSLFIDRFLESKNLIFFYSSWKYLLLFIAWDWIFLQLRFQICCYIRGPTRSGAVNLTQPMI